MNVFDKAELIVLGGHKQVGKTTWVVSELTRLAKKGVVFTCDVDDYRNVDTEVFELADMTAQDVAEQAKLCHQKHDGLDYVVVDAFHDLSCEDVRGAWNDAVGILRSLVVDLNCPVLVITNFSRAHKTYPFLKDFLAQNFLTRQQGLVEKAEKVIMLHRFGFMRELDDVTPDMVRQKWIYLVLGKGFSENDGSDVLLQFDEVSKQMHVCEHQNELKQSIAVDMAAVKDSLDLLEIQKKEREEQERRDSLPDRIEVLEEKLEEALSMVEDIQSELNKLKGESAIVT